MKRRRFIKDVFCWSTALAAGGWLSQTSNPQPTPAPTPDGNDKPKDIPEPDVQPCYGVSVPPEKP